jgi:predicted Fe-Mo cluster-binding NifX family protein
MEKANPEVQMRSCPFAENGASGHASRLGYSILSIIMDEKIQLLICESIMPRKYAINLINNGFRLTGKNTLDGKVTDTLETHLSAFRMFLQVSSKVSGQFAQIPPYRFCN